MRETMRTRSGRDPIPEPPETQGADLEPGRPEEASSIDPADDEADAWDLFVTSTEGQALSLTPILEPSLPSLPSAAVPAAVPVAVPAAATVAVPAAVPAAAAAAALAFAPRHPGSASTGFEPEFVNEPERESVPGASSALQAPTAPDPIPASPDAAMSDNSHRERNQSMSTATASASSENRETMSFSMNESEEKAQLRDFRAMDIIHKHVLAAMGAGLVPIPLVDVAAITALQMKMIRDLAQFYQVKLAKNQLTYSLIGSVTAGVGAPMAITPLLSSSLKLIPGFGTAAGVASLPIVGGACTYALGKVFAGHFEAGGTLFTFDPAKVRERMRSYYTEGLKKAEELKHKPASASAA